jgi:hypothetical protein
VWLSSYLQPRHSVEFTRVGSGASVAIRDALPHRGMARGRRNREVPPLDRELAQYSKKATSTGTSCGFPWQIHDVNGSLKLGQNGLLVATTAKRRARVRSAVLLISTSTEAQTSSGKTRLPASASLAAPRRHYYSGMYLETISPEWEIASAGDFMRTVWRLRLAEYTHRRARDLVPRDGVFQSGIYMETIPPEWRSPEQETSTATGMRISSGRTSTRGTSDVVPTERRVPKWHLPADRRS